MDLMNYSIEGIGSFYGGEYNKVSIEGLGKLKDKLICNEVRVEGLFKSKGLINTKLFKCEGVSRIFENIKAEEISIEGVLKVRGASLEADRITCDGVITSDKEVSADKIVIEGSVSIAFLVGDDIEIKGYLRSNVNITLGFINLFSKLYTGRKLKKGKSLIDVIECTNLKADNIKAKEVRAKNITLEENCVIDYLEYSGELSYDESCIIKKIVKV